MPIQVHGLVNQITPVHDGQSDYSESLDGPWSSVPSLPGTSNQAGVLKGTFWLQSTVTCFNSSDKKALLLTSSVYRCKRPNVKADRLQNPDSMESLATHLFPWL